MNIPTHTSNVIRYSDLQICTSCKLQITFSNYFTSVLMKKCSNIYLLIIKLMIMIQGPTIKSEFYSWIGPNKILCPTQWYMITWNSVPDVLKVNVCIVFCVKEQCTGLRYVEILVVAESHFDHIVFLKCIYCLSNCWVCSHCTVKFLIVLCYYRQDCCCDSNCSNDCFL